MKYDHSKAGSVKDAFHQFARNGRWGTCVGCPHTDDGNVFPEFCEFTKRYDHQLDLDSLVETYRAYTRVKKEES